MSVPIFFSCGSPPYASPELYKDEPYEGGPVDAWALGVLLYFMTEGRLPFIGTSIPNLKRNILNGLSYTIHCPFINTIEKNVTCSWFNLIGEYMMSGNLSVELMDLIQKILQQRASRRLTVAEMIIHPWLTPDAIISGSQVFSSHSSAESPARSFNTNASLSEDSGDSLSSTVNTRQEHCSIIRRDTNGKIFPTTVNRAICRSIPTKEQILYRLVSNKEIQAFEILLDIGIPEHMIEAHRSRGVRSYVIGIYRMLLHKLEKGDEIDFAKFSSTNMNNSMTNMQNEISSSNHNHAPPPPPSNAVNKGPVKMNSNNSPIRFRDNEPILKKDGDETGCGNITSIQEEGSGSVEESCDRTGDEDLKDLDLNELRKSELASKQNQPEDTDTVVSNCQAVPSTTCTIL